MQIIYINLEKNIFYLVFDIDTNKSQLLIKITIFCKMDYNTETEKCFHLNSNGFYASLSDVSFIVSYKCTSTNASS